mgnify:CR=1 FL=1
MPNTPSPAHIANTLMIFLRDSMWRSIIIVLLLFSTSVSGCLQKEQGSGDFILATTTSMRDSGLLDELLSTFSDEYGVFIGVVAVGTGAALKLGENGEMGSGMGTDFGDFNNDGFLDLIVTNFQDEVAILYKNDRRTNDGKFDRRKTLLFWITGNHTRHFKRCFHVFNAANPDHHVQDD